jgi:poly-gamma-glutamate synthesis protein (capsule biosynthesis protein)
LAFLLLITALPSCEQGGNGKGIAVITVPATEDTFLPPETEGETETECATTVLMETAPDTVTTTEAQTESATEAQTEPATEAQTEPVTEPAPEVYTITLSFLGDCMLASYKGEYGKGKFNTVADQLPASHFFEKMYPILSSDDFTVANCENVFTDRDLTEKEKDHDPAYWYKSPSKNAAIFQEGSVEILSIANNHISDYGSEGKKDTKAALEAQGLLWGNESRSVIVEKHGVRIGIAMCGLWNTYQIDRAVKLIDALEEKTDYQIVYYHGGTERKYTPDAWRVTASERLVDAGADLVIGGHPHVLQPMTSYKGVDILYSIGNFLFGGSKKSDRFTIVYQKVLTVSEGVILEESCNIIPVYEYEGSSTTTWQPYPMEEGSEDYEAVLAFLRGETKSPKP